MKTADEWVKAGLAQLELSRSADSSREYREDLEEALRCFTEAIAADASNLEAQRQRGLILSTLGQAEEALDALATVAAGTRLTRDEELTAARALRRSHRVREAISVLERTLARNPEDAELILELADALFEVRRDEDAIAQWDRGLVRGSTTGLFFFHLGGARLKRARALARLGRPQAEVAFRELLTSEATLGPSFDQLVYEALREAPVARRVYQDWLDERPDDVGAWTYAADRLSGGGALEQALAAWEHVLRRAPTDSRAWFGRAETLVKAGRLDEAIEAYRTSLKHEPGFLGAQARLDVALKQKAGG